MSIIKKTASDVLLNNYRQTFPPNTVKCPRYIMFELTEVKRLIAAIDAYNKTQPAGSKVTQIKSIMAAERPSPSTHQLNMFLTSAIKDFNLDGNSADTEVVLGRPCPPHCVTDNRPVPDHYLES